MATMKKCEHAACTCPPLKGKRYCSEVCRKINKSNPVDLVPCQCGHADCAGDPRIHTKPAEEAPTAAPLHQPDEPVMEPEKKSRKKASRA
jgi:hypothetical protein